MKFEIEIPEEEIRNEVSKKIHTAVKEYSSSYYVDDEVKKLLRKYWSDTVESLVQEELKNAEALRKVIRTAMENKVKAQLQALMRVEK